MGEAIRHDPPRQARPDPREPGQLLGARLVDVDPLAGPERAGEAPGAVALRGRVAWPDPAQWRYPTRRLAGTAGAPACQMSCQSQREQRQDGPMFGAHAPMLTRRRIPGESNPCAPGHFPASRTSAVATSPTTWRLAALTLSIVSYGVCQDG